MSNVFPKLEKVKRMETQHINEFQVNKSLEPLCVSDLSTTARR